MPALLRRAFHGLRRVAEAPPAPYIEAMTHAANHHSIKVISRAKGHSAVAAAAYEAGICLTDDRTGQTHDYTPRGGVESVVVVGWKDDQPGSLWNAAESAEKRKNSTVARHAKLAIPKELDQDERKRLARGYALWLRDKYGVAAQVANHAPDRKGDPNNWHAHILFTTRTVSDDGTFGDKTRVLDDYKTRKTQMLLMRAEWAKRCNSLLEKKGVKERVDPRSLKQRAKEDGTPELPAIPHFGKAATAMMRDREKKRRDTGKMVPRMRLEMVRDRVQIERAMLGVAHAKLVKAKQDLQSAEAEQIHSPAPPPPPPPKDHGPTVDDEKRAQRLREALEALTKGQNDPLEWSDPPTDGDKHRGRGNGRVRRR